MTQTSSKMAACKGELALEALQRLPVARAEKTRDGHW